MNRRNPIDIITALHDSRLFLPVFRDIKTWRSWQVYLKSLFGLPIQDEQELKLFKECTGLETPPLLPAKESFVLAGRRSGKSFISSILAVYLATFRDWSKVLSPGEIGWIFIIATDKAQAAIIKRYTRAIIDSSPPFRKLVKGETQETIELRNGVSIGIKTSNFRSVRGYTLLAAILEELAFWRSEDSVCPDRETLSALRPALSTVPDSLLLGISTVYSRSGVLYDSWKTHYGQPGGPLIWKAESLMMNPTLDVSIIQRELEADPESAKAEWLSIWRTDISSFIPMELIESCSIPARYELPCMEDVRYFGFTDPSGGRSDSFTLAIAHKGAEGRVLLDVLLERKPPFSPESTVEEFSAVLKNFGLSQVHGDAYAASWCSDTWRKFGIYYLPSEKSASELYLGLLPLLASGKVELLDQKRLKGQLAGLERRVRAGGRDLITHGPGMHDDVSNACAGAVGLAYSEPQRDDLTKLWTPVRPKPALSDAEQSKRAFRDFLAGRKPSEEELEEAQLMKEILEEEKQIEKELEAEGSRSFGFTKHGWK